MRSSKRAVILVGHGSKALGFDRAMKRVALRLRQRGYRVICAFLEINPPSIPEAIEKAAKQSTRIDVLPYFLLRGNHIVRDIPEIIREARKKHGSSVEIRLCPYLGFDEAIVKVVEKRLKP